MINRREQKTITLKTPGWRTLEMVTRMYLKYWQSKSMKKIPVFKHNTDDDFEIYTKTKVVTTLGLEHFSHYCYIFICFDF